MHLSMCSCSDSWSRGRQLREQPERQAHSRTWLSSVSGEFACSFSVCLEGPELGPVFPGDVWPPHRPGETLHHPRWTSGVNDPEQVK